MVRFGLFVYQVFASPLKLEYCSDSQERVKEMCRRIQLSCVIERVLRRSLWHGYEDGTDGRIFGTFWGAARH